MSFAQSVLICSNTSTDLANFSCCALRLVMLSGFTPLSDNSLIDFIYPMVLFLSGPNLILSGPAKVRFAIYYFNFKYNF
uniref:Uncharacterized protein n=1 Tax=Meloidogyne enterolobii TaxID=390850 RepID=A0A6V7Y789_MELEN|nr:unnamed protein product [Meloidogyne enterolobii]